MHLSGEDGEQPGGGGAAAGADGHGPGGRGDLGHEDLGRGSHHTDADDAGGDRPRVRLDVRYFAGAAAAAGLEQEVVLLEHRSATLAGLLEHLSGVHPPLAPVLAVATALVDELAVTEGATPLRDGARVDVLPPFAGG